MKNKIIKTTIMEGKPHLPSVYLFKGLPASGKSYEAEILLNKNIDSRIRLNKDLIRSMIGDVYTQDRENLIINALRDLGVAALKDNFTVIIDDTNFNPKHRDFWELICKENGYTMYEWFVDTPVDVCVERDINRGTKVGAKVITDMYHKYINKVMSTLREYREQGENLEPCIIVDIDGTVALIKDRNPYDNTRVHTDVPNIPVVDLINNYAGLVQVIFVTGREDTVECRTVTAEWLDENLLDTNYKLLMRPKGDYRKDATIKKEIYETQIENKWFVNFVLDDRDQTVKMWRDELNLPCFQVFWGKF